MKILTERETRLAEQKCFDNYYTEAELMLRAGTACFELMTEKYNMKNRRVLVLCGNGKNAGDGFVIARLLYCYGSDVKIVLCDRAPEISEPLKYYEEALSSGVEAVGFERADTDGADYIVDCVFGIGFRGEPRAPFDTVFEAVGKSGATVISVDTPSGSSATDGTVCKNCIRADFTIAVSTLKYCHVLPPANDFCGEVVTADIGIPADCYDFECPETIEKDDIRKLFTRRGKNANKGSFGNELIISGSYKMFGAAVIAVKAALRSGAGLVKLAVPEKAYPLVASHLTQSVFNPVYSNEEGTFSEASCAGVLQDTDWADSVVLGCGIGVNEDTEQLVEAVLKNAKCPVILDADGINCIKSRISILEEIKAPIVLTPHPGEMARLISKQVAEIQENRIDIAKSFAKENRLVLVLKGANTVVTDGNKVFVNTTGNPGMAMGGTGDMLSGMLGAFIAQGLSPLDAARAAVYIHGLCGDRAAQIQSMRGMLVSDMTEQLGALMSEFE